MAMLTLRLDDELNDRITALAKRSGRTKTYFIKRLIVEAIMDLEDEIWAEQAVLEHRAAIARGEDPEWVDFFEFMKEIDREEMELEAKQASAKELEQNASKRSRSSEPKGGPTGRTTKSRKAGKAA